MAIWILSRYKHKFNAIAQIAIIAIMNILEFLLVPDILLWGKLNSFFALLFILLIYYNEFVLTKNKMFDFLKNHPFPVEAFFLESSTVLTFAVPKEQLQDLIPECLELDTFKEKFGFIAVAMVQTKNLRPKGFPKFLGNDFFLIGYRIFVRFINEKGKRLRGLFILKSETDKKKMEVLGNIFTKYSYTTTDINQSKTNNIIEINSKKSKFNLTILNTFEEIPLPENSPFENWKEARHFGSVHLPFTFSYTANDKKVLIIEGVMKNSTPNPLKVIDYNFEFLKLLNLSK